MKKIMCCLLLMILVFSLLGCGPKEKEFFIEQDGFVLEISIDERVIENGHELTIRAVLKNNTGSSHKIILSSSPVILLEVFPTGTNASFFRYDDRMNTVMEENAIFESSMVWKASENGRYFLMVQASLTIVEDYSDPWTSWTEIKIYSKKITIRVK